jgi:hypothetical protein
VDYRIYDPDGDGKTKLDHVEDMQGRYSLSQAIAFWERLDG